MFDHFSSDKNELRALEKTLLKSFVDYSLDAIITKDLKGKITGWNASAERIFGYTAVEMIGKSILTIIPPDRLDEEAIILQRLSLDEKIVHFKTERLRKDGEKVYLSVTIFPIKNPKGKILGACKIARDITKDKKTKETQQLLSSLINSSDDAIISKTLKGIITSWNPAAERIFGYTSQEIIGKSILLLIPSDRLHEESVIIEKISAGEKIDHFETIRLTKEGNRVHVTVSISPIKNTDGIIIGASKIARDITELTLQRHLATHDALTGLMTLRSTYDRLDKACKNAKKEGKKVAVLFMDLDGFKIINDTYGHRIGDMVLKLFSERLLGSVRESDTVARVGGDEFLIILETVSKKTDIEAVAKKILTTMDAPITYKKHVFEIGLSIGIAVFPEDGVNHEELLKNADLSMYDVKKSGKNNFQFHSVRKN